MTTRLDQGIPKPLFAGSASGVGALRDGPHRGNIKHVAPEAERLGVVEAGAVDIQVPDIFQWDPCRLPTQGGCLRNYEAAVRSLGVTHHLEPTTAQLFAVGQRGPDIAERSSLTALKVTATVLL